MNEEIVLQILKQSGINLVASLPCDKNKRLTELLSQSFHVIDLAREEDGVGICAGAYLVGKKPILSIQSSGIGNMLNALMSLSVLYELPLPILASWRGVENESICAQIPFNRPLPELLDVYGIPYRIFSTAEDLKNLGQVIEAAFLFKKPYVALILPSCWGSDLNSTISYPPRLFSAKSIYLNEVSSFEMNRFEAIQTISETIDSNAILISNIGVPSKELYAIKDRVLNFYMLGSYTQASSIGFGCSLGTDRPVYVIDGDGSLLGSAVLPVIAAENPSNLTIFALDNGTFGSTGNQLSPAYKTADLGLIAAGAGIKNIIRIGTKQDLIEAVEKSKETLSLIHILIRPGNSINSNIPLLPREIRDRFISNFR